MKKTGVLLVIIFATLFSISTCAGLISEENKITTSTGTIANKQSSTPTSTLTTTKKPTATITLTSLPTNTPTPTFTPTPDIPVDINSYFPQPLTPINTENISNIEVLGKLGEGQLLEVIANENQTKITAVYNARVLSLDANTLEVNTEIEVEVPLGFKNRAFRVSPDGNYFALSTKSNVLVYDLITGEQIQSFTPYLPDYRESNLYSRLFFSNDSKTLIRSMDVNTGWVAWRLPDGDEILKEKGKPPIITSSDLVCVIDDKSIILKNLHNGEEVNEIKTDSDIEECYVSADGSMLVAVNESTNEIWDLQTRKQISDFVSNSYYWTPSISPDRKYAYAYSSLNGNHLRFWRVEDGKILTTIDGLTYGAEPLFTPDGKKFALKAFRGGIKSVLIYDTKRFFQLASFSFGDRTSGVVLMTSDGKYIVAYSASHERAKIIDVENLEVSNTIYGITDWDIQIVAEHYLLAKTEHATKIYDIYTGESVYEIPFVAEDMITMGDTILLTDEFSKIYLWSLRDEEFLASRTPVHRSRYYTSLENMDKLFVWGNVINDETIKTFYELSQSPGLYSALPTLNYSTESKVYIQYIEGKLNIYEMEDYSNESFRDAKLLHQFANLYLKENLIRLTPDGRTIIAADKNNSIFLWSTETGTLINELATDFRIQDIVVSPGSDDFYVSGSSDYYNIVNLYQLPDGRLNLSNWYSAKRHRSDGWDACFVSPLSLSIDGKYLLRPAENCFLQIIDTTNNEVIQTIDYGVNSRVRAAISPDGDILALGTYGPVIEFWDISSGKKIHTIDLYERFHNHKRYTPSVRFSFTLGSKLFAITRGEYGSEILLYGIYE